MRLFVNDTENVLLAYPPAGIQQDDRVVAALQFALQRGMEQHFQIEEAEIASERIGSGDRRAILYWEAAEGGVEVLRRIVEEADLFAAVAAAAGQEDPFETLLARSSSREREGNHRSPGGHSDILFAFECIADGGRRDAAAGLELP